MEWALSFVPNHPSKIYLHSMEEVPSYEIRSQFVWEMGKFVDVLLEIKQTFTSAGTKQLTTGQRKCIFQGEVDLLYYKNDIYSTSACTKQCRMLKVHEICHCIPPFYEPASGNYQPCTFTDLKCLVKNFNNITSIRDCKECHLSCIHTVYESEKIRYRFLRLNGFESNAQ